MEQDERLGPGVAGLGDVHPDPVDELEAVADPIDCGHLALDRHTILPVPEQTVSQWRRQGV